MPETGSLRTGLNRIRGLVGLQHGTRLLIRATWLGISGFLIGVSLPHLFARSAVSYPDWFVWALAAAFAAPALIGAFRIIGAEVLAWRMDRLLGLREQVTTAVRVDAGGGERGAVAQALIDDTRSLFPGLFSRIAARGWYLRRDLEALALVAILLAGAVLTGRAGIQFQTPETQAGEIPAIALAPGFSDVFPSGIPGLTGTAPGVPEGNPAPGAPGASEEDFGVLDNILTDLGEALSEHPETADIGEALQNGDLEEAAAAIERTADNVDLLPEEARRNLQQALQQAAQQAQAAGQEDLAEDLQAAADALENTDPNNPMAADALDELAEGLRDLGEAFGSMGQPGEGENDGTQEGPDVGSAAGESGSGSGAGVAGISEPISRLEGEGDDFGIQGGDDPSGLLLPSSGSSDPTSSAGSSTSTTGAGPAGTGPIDSVLTPYSFPWNWRDVVSDYFSP